MIWKFSRDKRRAASPAPSPAPAVEEARPGDPDVRAGDPDASATPSPRRAGHPGADASDGVDFEVSRTQGHARADAVPDQDEDELPHRRLDDRPLSRADRVGEALDRWSAPLTLASQGPSFLSQLRAGDHVLDLTHSHPSGLAQLLAGRGATRLSSLVREVGALADARGHARALRETAERQAEEIGLTTCHLAIGEATWQPEDGGEPVHAPVLVRPITLRLRGNAREDIELEIDATVDVNPVLLRALREAGVAVDARALLATTDGPYGFDPNPVLDAFRALGEPLPGFRVTHALVVGNLMDAVGPLARDLSSERADWVEHPLVAAMAGDPGAREALAADADEEPAAPVPETDLVAAVDPDRQHALEQVLAGRHVALSTPPGTDANDLVVDLMAELNARGRSVLVVSQRRRSLSQIAALAEERGLADLLFDLSPDPALQRTASESLLTSLRRAGSFRAGSSLEESPALRDARDTLVGHVEAMHRVQQPWGASAHDAISALAALTRSRPAPRTTVRLSAEVAARMIGEERARFAVLLREAAEAGALSTGPEDTAWFGATITTDTQARRARELVTELREEILPPVRERVASVSGDLGLREVRDLAALHRRIALLERVRTVLVSYQGAVFAAPLEDLAAATADKTWRVEHGVEMRWGARRRLRKQALELERPEAEVPDPHAVLAEARRVREAWRKETASAGAPPRVPPHLDRLSRLAERAQRACDELAVLLDGTIAGGELATEDLGILAARLDALDADSGSLADLPRHTTLVRRLRFDGLGELVDDLRDRRVSASQVSAELDLAWWRSVLELIAGAEPKISTYDGTSLSRVAETFRRLDAEHLAESADRVRTASDDVLVKTMKRFPDTSRSAIAELSRSSTTSVRDLAAKYEDILFRARPSWLASPYLVPQIVPRGTHFDVVIVADGGRLPTWAALPAILRARQTVIVGDPLEYAGEGHPVLLDDVRDLVPSLALRRDPHPATGGVRAFAQRRAAGPGVLAAPSPTVAEPDRLVLVEAARGLVTPGAEYVESTEAELRRVTDLVIEHARTRPERSLGVITFTPAHAQAVLERVLSTVGVVPMLRGFFDPDSEEFFTVVPVAHTPGLVRDDVIVSLGFGMTPHGRLIHHFGPISGDHGRKAVVSALTRARGRTTVVSGLRAEDLDVSRLRTEGAQDLHDLLTYLYTGEDPLVTGRDAAHDAGAPAAGIFTASSAAIRTAEPDGAEPVDAPKGAEAEREVSTSADDATMLRPDGAERPSAPASAQGGGAVAVGSTPAPDLVTGTDDSSPVRDATTADGTTPADTAEDLDPSVTSDEVPRTSSDVDPGAPDAVADDGTADPGPAETTPSEDSTEGPSGDVSPIAEGDGDAAPDPDTDGVVPIAPGATVDAAGALVADLADRLWRLGLVVEADFGQTEDRIELALGHPDLPGRFLVAVDTDGPRYVATTSQRERDRLRAERLEGIGWHPERVWSWALFIDPEGEADRIRRAVERALTAVQDEDTPETPRGVGSAPHRVPRPQIAAGRPLSFYATEDFDAVVEYICSDGRARLEDQLAGEVRTFLGFERRSVLLDVAVASAVRRYQERL